MGAYGEWSRTMDRFISDVAAKGLEVPERFGCCHGPEHAQGVIASFARTLLGRTALRGVACLRLKALDAITVNCGHDHAPGFADAAGAANAWGVSVDIALAPPSHPGLLVKPWTGGRAIGRRAPLLLSYAIALGVACCCLLCRIAVLYPAINLKATF